MTSFNLSTRRYLECENSRYQIGFGPNVFIYKARDTLTDDIVFIKKRCLDNFDDTGDGIPRTVIRETSILRELTNHPNIVQLINCVSEIPQSVERNVMIGSRSVSLVFECQQEELSHFIRSRFQNSMLPQDLVKSFMYQICNAVAYCHSHGVMHRNLTPTNILVNQNGDGIKLSGFSMARSFHEPLSNPLTMEVTILWYRAPEILLGMENYTPEIDLFAIGCIFAEMVSKEALFNGRSEIDHLFKIFRQLGTPDECSWPGVLSAPYWNIEFPKWHKMPFDEKIRNNLSSEGLDLLDKFLVLNSRRRILAKNALSHDYFIDINNQHMCT